MQKESYSLMMWDKVLKIWDNKYGRSALTTFWAARYVHGFSFSQSFALMQMQIKELGNRYEGGLDCCKYRGEKRISAALN
jgi:hypothetical protein